VSLKPEGLPLLQPLAEFGYLKFEAIPGA